MTQLPSETRPLQRPPFQSSSDHSSRAMVCLLQTELSRRVRSDGGARRHGRAYHRFAMGPTLRSRLREKMEELCAFRLGRARRPWMTVWQDLRTSIIWGWYLDRKPSSETASLAYADGILNFGAQQPPRPEENFHSYIYTDQGKDYRSHNWNVQVIALHQQAMTPSGSLELILMQRQVGIPEDRSG